MPREKLEKDQRNLGQGDHFTGKNGDFIGDSFQESHVRWTSGSAPGFFRVADTVLDPLLENNNTESTWPANQGHVGTDHKENPREPEVQKVLCGPDGVGECLSKLPEPRSPESSSQDMKSPSIGLSDSPAATLQPKESKEAGKKPKARKSLSLEPNIRDAITALLAKARISQAAKEPHVTECPEDPRRSGCPPCKSELGLPLPNPAINSVGKPDDQGPCCTRPSTPESLNKEVQEFIKTMKDSGYVIKKDPKLVGSGQSIRPSGSAPIKKNEVECPNCQKFRGRPCELKYNAVCCLIKQC
jgi:hypothetical protein